MTIRMKITDDFPLTFFPASREQEIEQQLVILIKTMQGECPMYRDFGLSPAWKHASMNAAETAFATTLAEAVRKYCPGMLIQVVGFDHDTDTPGTMRPVMEVTFDE